MKMDKRNMQSLFSNILTECNSGQNYIIQDKKRNVKNLCDIVFLINSTGRKLNYMETNNQKRKKRLLALDAARGLAVIGMFIQHFALNERNADIVSGNTMILFILCSGISYTLMSQNAAKSGIEEKIFRTKILTKSVFIDLIGYLLILLNGPFAVILTAYAVLFVMAIPLRKCSDKMLAWVSGGLLIISPVIMIAGMNLFSRSAMIADIAGGSLSGIALLPVFTLGMLIGRKDMRNIKRAFTYILAGIVCILLIKILAAYVLPNVAGAISGILEARYATMSEIDEYAAWPKNVWPISWNMLFTAMPQSGSTFTLILGIGVSLVVLGVTILLESRIPVLLKPFAMTGQVALTLYVLQIVIGWVLLLFGVETDFGSFVLGDILVAVMTVVIGCILVKTIGGPIEKTMRKFENLFCE